MYGRFQSILLDPLIYIYGATNKYFWTHACTAAVYIYVAVSAHAEPGHACIINIMTALYRSISTATKPCTSTIFCIEGLQGQHALFYFNLLNLLDMFYINYNSQIWGVRNSKLAKCDLAICPHACQLILC